MKENITGKLTGTLSKKDSFWTHGQFQNGQKKEKKHFNDDKKRMSCLDKEILRVTFLGTTLNNTVLL